MREESNQDQQQNQPKLEFEAFSHKNRSDSIFLMDPQQYEVQCLNKLCQENYIYFCANSDMAISNTAQGQVYELHEDSQNLQNNSGIDQQEIPRTRQREKIIFHKLYSYNILLYFIVIFLILFIFLCLLSPFFICFYIGFLFQKYKKLRKQQILSKVSILIEVMILIFMLNSCGFFVIQLIYFNKFNNNEANIEFQGINLLTFFGLIYNYCFMVGLLIYQQFSQTNFRESQDALERLPTSCCKLYFELMDRNNITNFLKKPKIKSQIYSFLNLSMQRFKIHPTLEQIALNNKIRTIKKKWNSGFYLLKREQPSSLNKFIMADRSNYKNLVINLGVAVVVFFLQIYYLQDKVKSPFDSANLVFLIFANYFTCFCTYLNQHMMTYTYEGFSKVETFTSLLETKIKNSEYEFERSVATLNIYCIQSIKTWFQIRQLMLNLNEKFFKYMNIPQLLEVICFFTLSGILIMDYLGLGWSKYDIIQNELLLSLFLINIFLRLSLFIYPIFNNFSYVNDLLEYNLEQAKSIKKRLEDIQPNYSMLRNPSGFQQQNQDDRETNVQENNANHEFIQFPTIHEIQEQRAIFEIKRNALLYSHYPNLHNSYQNLTTEQLISIEENYLSNLIKEYKTICKDMKNEQDKHQLKFLGIFTISYGKAKALCVIIISPLITFLYQYLQS